MGQLAFLKQELSIMRVYGTRTSVSGFLTLPRLLSVVTCGNKSNACDVIYRHFDTGVQLWRWMLLGWSGLPERRTN